MYIYMNLRTNAYCVHDSVFAAEIARAGKGSNDKMETETESEKQRMREIYVCI